MKMEQNTIKIVNDSILRIFSQYITSPPLEYIIIFFDLLTIYVRDYTSAPHFRFNFQSQILSLFFKSEIPTYTTNKFACCIFYLSHRLVRTQH